MAAPEILRPHERHVAAVATMDFTKTVFVFVWVGPAGDSGLRHT